MEDSKAEGEGKSVKKGRFSVKTVGENAGSNSNIIKAAGRMESPSGSITTAEVQKSSNMEERKEERKEQKKGRFKIRDLPEYEGAKGQGQTAPPTTSGSGPPTRAHRQVSQAEAFANEIPGGQGQGQCHPVAVPIQQAVPGFLQPQLDQGMEKTFADMLRMLYESQQEVLRRVKSLEKALEETKVIHKRSDESRQEDDSKDSFTASLRQECFGKAFHFAEQLKMELENCVERRKSVELKQKHLRDKNTNLQERLNEEKKKTSTLQAKLDAVKAGRQKKKDFKQKEQQLSNGGSSTDNLQAIQPSGQVPDQVYLQQLSTSGMAAQSLQTNANIPEAVYRQTLSRSGAASQQPPVPQMMSQSTQQSQGRGASQNRAQQSQVPRSASNRDGKTQISSQPQQLVGQQQMSYDQQQQQMPYDQQQQQMPYDQQQQPQMSYDQQQQLSSQQQPQMSFEQQKQLQAQAQQHQLQQQQMMAQQSTQPNSYQQQDQSQNQGSMPTSRLPQQKGFDQQQQQQQQQQQANRNQAQGNRSQGQASSRMQSSTQQQNVMMQGGYGQPQQQQQQPQQPQQYTSYSAAAAGTGGGGGGQTTAVYQSTPSAPNPSGGNPAQQQGGQFVSNQGQAGAMNAGYANSQQVMMTSNFQHQQYSAMGIVGQPPQTQAPQQQSLQQQGLQAGQESGPGPGSNTSQTQGQYGMRCNDDQDFDEIAMRKPKHGFSDS